MNFLNNEVIQPSKFRTKSWVEINDDVRGKCNTNSQIKFKTTILKSRFSDYSDAYMLVKETMAVGTGAAATLIKRMISK